jgi:hypothetical protein
MEGILAILAPPGNNVIPFVELCQQARDVGRVVLEVAVHGDDDAARCGVESGSHGCCLAEVAAEAQELHPPVFGGNPFQELERGVARAVIHKDEFVFQ